MIDRIDELTDGPDASSSVGAKIKARKNVTINEPYFQGHFPHRPVMPGVLQIEAMAQAGGLACYSSVDRNIKYELLITGLDKAKFRKPVVPGDTLILEGEIVKDRAVKNGSRIVVIDCRAKVDDEIVSQVEIKAFIQPKQVLIK